MSGWPAAAAMLVVAALVACERAPAPPSPSAAPAATSSSTPSPPPAQPATDEFVLPGAFAADTTVADLERRFGKSNVTIGTLPGAEGESHRGVTLFTGDPAREARLYFHDERTLRGLSRVAVDHAASRWRTDTGVRMGMTLSDLVALNGGPLAFSGFDWDYGGYVTSWLDGALEPKADDSVRRGVQLGFAPGDDTAHPIGDSEFRSDNPDYPDLGKAAVVTAISASFSRENNL